MLSAILQANSNSADICFALALVLLLAVAVIEATKHDVERVVQWVAIALIALGFLFLTP